MCIRYLESRINLATQSLHPGPQFGRPNLAKPRIVGQHFHNHDLKDFFPTHIVTVQPDFCSGCLKQGLNELPDSLASFRQCRLYLKE